MLFMVYGFKEDKVQINNDDGVVKYDEQRYWLLFVQ